MPTWRSPRRGFEVGVIDVPSVADLAARGICSWGSHA
jgi:hypothetical protein